MSATRNRSVALSVAWRTLHNVFHNPALLLPSLIFPLVFLMTVIFMTQTPRTTKEKIERRR